MRFRDYRARVQVLAVSVGSFHVLVLSSWWFPGTQSRRHSFFSQVAAPLLRERVYPLAPGRFPFVKFKHVRDSQFEVSEAARPKG